MARYEFRKGKTEKFWAPRLEGARMFLHFGKIGSAGQTRLKDFTSAGAAKSAMAEAVAEKLGDGYLEVGAKSTKAAKVKPALSSAKRTALLALATELGTKKIVAEVAMAIDTPEAYIEKFLDEYEVIEDAEHGEVPWLGMIEALNAGDRLTEVDWKEAGSEICAGLERVGGAVAKRALRPAHAEGDDLDERPTHEALERFGQLLGTAKLALIQLDKSSDSYALCVVPVARVAPLQKLARAAGERIEQFSGKALAALEQERAKKLAKEAKPKDAWKQLVAHNAHRATDGAADSVLWDLQHTASIDEVRAALPFVPERDRPLVEMTLAVYDNVPMNLAKTTRDPELLLRALRYLNPNEPERRYQRLAAAAVLAERMAIAFDGGKQHMLILAACNVWNEGKATDNVVAKLPGAARERLARAGDAMLERARGEGTDRWAAALRMLETVGDTQSLPVLETAFAKALVVRRDNEYDTDAQDWDAVRSAIRRRSKRR